MKAIQKRRIALEEIVVLAARECYKHWGFSKLPVSIPELRVKVSNALMGYGVDHNTIDRCINWAADPTWGHPAGIAPLAHALNSNKLKDRGFYIPNPECFEGKEKERLIGFYDTEYPSQVGKFA